MNTDQLLRQMFVEHEHLAPGVEETLREVHDRVDSRTGVTRLSARPRPFIVVATGLGVAATVVGIVAASILIKADRGPAGPTRPATNSTQPTPSRATSTSSHTRPAPVAALDYVTVAAGYLPGQATQVYVGNGILGEQRNYVVTDGPTSTKVDLTSAASTAVLLGTTTFTGSGTAVEVGGEAAHLWAATGRARVVIPRPGGVTAVDVTRTAMPSAAIAALTRQVAGQMRYQRHDAIKPEFRLGYVPAGLRIGQLGVDNHGATTWLLTETAVYGAGPTHGANTQVYSTIAPPVLSGPRNRTVQGHATQTGTKAGVPVLEIFNAAGRHTIVISGGPWAMSLSELYKIGDALVLPG